MGLDIKVSTEDYLGNEDRRWLGARLGADVCRSITLDASAFASYHVSERGFVPSGTVLGRITATGLYAPYDPAAANGLEVAAGLLFNSTKIGAGTGTDLATAGDVGAPLFWMGIVKKSFLPTFTGGNLGELDAAAEVDLGGFIRFEA